MVDFAVAVAVAVDPTPILADPALWFPVAASFAALVSAGLPNRKVERRVEAGERDARLALYDASMLRLWLLAAVCVGGWLASGRSLSALGFNLGDGAGGIAAWALAGLGSAYLLFSLVRTAVSADARRQLGKALANSADYDLVRPESPAEHRRFQLVAFTAGVTEETVFRGFLICAFALAAPFWIAAAAATAMFVLGHFYQGPKGMVRTIPISIVFAAMFAVSGSILPGIVLHWMADAVGGGLFALAQGADDDASYPPNEPAAPGNTTGVSAPSFATAETPK